MARSRYRIVNDNVPYFLTATVVNWLPLFTTISAKETLLNSLRYLQAQERLVVYAYVIMENHLHLVGSAADLGSLIGRFKSFTARQIIDSYLERDAQHILKQLAFYKRPHKTDRPYQLWQEGSHPQEIQGEAMMRQKIEYIHNNPVKRGWVDAPTDWRYSSARNYAGRPGLLDVETQW